MFIKRDVESFKQKYLSASFKPNILVCGDSGVGKSTLINDLLGKKVAEVSYGKAGTMDFNFYSGGSINIYDSKGRERDINIEEFLFIIADFIKKQNTSTDPRKHIHILLYCISEARIFKTMEWFINSLKKSDVKPIVCINKCDRLSQEELEGITAELNKLNIDSNDIIKLASPTIKFYQRQNESIKQGHSILMNKIFIESQHAYEIAVNNAEKFNHYKNIDNLNEILKRLIKNN